MELTPELYRHLQDFITGTQRLTVLTGAGISAESGIPTYRGVEGYWTKGSRNYKPEEIGTYDFFLREPREVWKFALHRRTVCTHATPNSGHQAIVRLEQLFEDRFTLITQNVDRLHIRAGNSIDRTYQIHGDIQYVRCSSDCTNKLYDFPQEIGPKKLDEEILDWEWELLQCPHCGDSLRPNVLWFDEVYEERLYQSESAIKAAKETGLLLIIGTKGLTNLPHQIFQTALYQESIIIDINPESTILNEAITDYEKGFLIRGNSGEILPLLIAEIQKIKEAL